MTAEENKRKILDQLETIIDNAMPIMIDGYSYDRDVLGEIYNLFHASLKLKEAQGENKWRDEDMEIFAEYNELNMLTKTKDNLKRWSATYKTDNK